MLRKLTDSESRLVRKMLSAVGGMEDLLSALDSLRVSEMNDGGMGSLKFDSSGGENRRLGNCISRAEFKDKDGVDVSAALNIDQYGNLYELDVWKVDFSPLQRWPSTEDIEIQKQF